MKVLHKINGKVVSPEEFSRRPGRLELGVKHGSLPATAGREASTTPESRRNSGYPFYSEGASVHPKDRLEAMQAARDAGVPTYYDKQGRPEIRSGRHQRRFLKTLGLHNKDGVT